MKKKTMKNIQAQEYAQIIAEMIYILRSIIDVKRPCEIFIDLVAL